MLNVPDYCVISPVTGEGAFLPSGTLYIVFLRHESEAQGLSAHCNKNVLWLNLSETGIVIIVYPSKQSSPKARLHQQQ